jgi:hypothetical protein
MSNLSGHGERELHNSAMLEMKEPRLQTSYQVATVKKVPSHPTTRVELHKPVVKQEKQPEVTTAKELSVVESDPFQVNVIKKYMMLTEQERIDIKHGNPELNVRLASKEEQIEHLCIADEAMEATAEGNEEAALTDHQRYKTYEEAMTWVYELAYKLWILNNRELLIMPDLKILRWKW